MKYGYARVSPGGKSESVDAQARQLTNAGCKKVFRDVHVSGAKTDRAQLRRVIEALTPGDVLMVTRLDRLARSTRDLLNTLAAITDRKAGFRSLGDAWADTTTSHGRLMLTVLGGLAEFERDLIRARTSEGRARAVARGEDGPTAEADAAPAARGDQAPRPGRGDPRNRPQLQRQPSDDFEARGMSAPIDGFYAVYVTGAEGQGLAMVVFRKGHIVGADAGGFKYDGQYSESPTGTLSIALSIKAPPNVQRVQGGTTGPQGEEFSLDFQLPKDFGSQDFVRVDTPRGPVNARLVKLRGLDD